MTVASLGDCGSGVFTPGSTTITVPLTQTIPRSDPAGGATILIVEVLANLENVVHTVSVADDGVEDPFYAEHIFTDGLNHYTQGPGWNTGSGDLSSSFAWWGLILNPLDATNSLTITLDAIPDDAVIVMVHAFTGVNVDTSGANWPGTGTDAAWLFTAGPEEPRTPSGVAADNVGANGGIDVRWEINSGTTITFLLPATVGYPDWEWLTGSLAFYNLWIESTSAGRGAWTWTSGDIDTINEFDAVSLPGISSFLYQVYAEQAVSAPLASQDLSGSLAADPDSEGLAGLQGFAAILLAGPGPTWPGLLLGVPVFNHEFRVGGDEN